MHVADIDGRGSDHRHVSEKHFACVLGICFNFEKCILR